ncbi:MAG: Wzt carbohydrate-binding domain-containing protein, partial [Oscillospiraceae bacterium]|nr:Wzt carbohydrate-binding domain-containing protein [Oscillospiraceae bacterium]
ERDIDLTSKERLGHISGAVLMTRLELLDTRDCVYEYEDAIAFRVTMRCQADVQNATMRFEIANAHGLVGLTFTEVFAREMCAGETYRVTMSFAGHCLTPGSYQAHISVGSGNSFEGISTFDGVYPAFAFEMLARRRDGLREGWRDSWGGTHLPPPQALVFERI